MKYHFIPLLTTISLAGFLFCLLSALGITDTLCLTQGCEVYQGYKVAGIFFYWFGAAVFLTLGLMSLWPGGYGLLAILTGLFLVGDFVFLIIQFLLWPCTSCLIVAALLGSFAWILAGTDILLSTCGATNSIWPKKEPPRSLLSFHGSL